MLLDLDLVLNSKLIELDLEFKNGKRKKIKLKTENLKSLVLTLTEKDYRKGIWDEDTQKNNSD